MKLTIQYRRQTLEVDLPDNATLLDLKKAVAPKAKLSIHRLRFKLGEVGLGANDKKLSDDGVKDGSTLVLRDLGLQVGYRTVFVVEYAGPLFIMLLYYLRPSILYFNSPKVSDAFTDTAKLGVWCWVAHFLKREFETFFVHKFSNPTMPVFNIFKNSMYYWSFGALCGYFLCHPLYTPPSNPIQVYTGLAIFVVAEVGNLICHLMLSNLRAAEGSTQRPIPKGFLFNLVSCPNYFFEVSAWVGFSIMTNLAFSWLFTLVGFLQMFAWAVKKHKGYLRTYGAEYKNLRRKAMVPFLM